MTGPEAIIGASRILADLILRIKDRQTAALVQQVQAHHLEIQGYIHQLESQLLDLKQKAFADQQAHAAAVATLNQQVATLKGKLTQAASGEPCPYCGHTANRPVNIKPHGTFGEMGMKVAYYKCGECGKEYDVELPPKPTGAWGSEPPIQF